MSLHGVYDDNNVFARILRGEIPGVRVFEDDQILIFMDAFPQSAGHLLVISKASRARNLLEVEPNVLAAVIAGVQKATQAVEQALKPDGIAVMQFNGSPAGQTVFHLHFHVIPRYAQQDMSPHGQAGPADRATLEGLADRIRTFL